MMKNLVKLFATVVAISFMAMSSTFAKEITCGSTGGMNRCPLPGADMMHVKVKQVLEGECKHEKGWWADSDGVVVDQGCNAVFQYTPAKGSASGSDGTDAKASAYYDDGCKAGKADKKDGLGMACKRHAV